jgi:sporulation protein YlmC with PRC-barrel domain
VKILKKIADARITATIFMLIICLVSLLLTEKDFPKFNDLVVMKGEVKAVKSFSNKRGKVNYKFNLKNYPKYWDGVLYVGHYNLLDLSKIKENDEVTLFIEKNSDRIWQISKKHQTVVSYQKIKEIKQEIRKRNNRSEKFAFIIGVPFFLITWFSHFIYLRQRHSF